ncbi:MAG: pyridoxamine 5-phosphate oxidase [Thermoleophilia bacterium]|nr:pyridoxamine 5-phosphate oxidase [Thermoleophilia bacterium]
MHEDLPSLRVEYGTDGFAEADAGADPMALFAAWLEAARGVETDREANAMTLATVGAGGVPSARMVLLKGIDPTDARFTWFTNLDSRKGLEVAANPLAALCWWWPAAGDVPGRQVRAVGRVVQLDRAASATYFDSRPIGARIGAAASHQSRAVPDRAALDARAAALTEPVRIPERWGGLQLVADELEFWQGRSGRLHDRVSFLRVDDMGRPRSEAAIAAAGGLDQLEAAALRVTDAAGTSWLRARLEP